jgi:pimeloyl-ACP methyl ester carboxylesterase
MSLQDVLAFEDAYRVVVPSYPFAAGRVGQLIGGLSGILDAEQADSTHVLGGSYGGLVAQCLVRQYPDRVDTLILSHTGVPQPDRAASNRRFLSLMHVLPTRLLRAMLCLSTHRSLADVPRRRAFWKAYSKELISQITKADLVSRYQVAIDMDRSCSFAPKDLEDWTGRILILEGDDDPVARFEARAGLKALYPHAHVHTFHGSGHAASIAKPDEYVATIKSFLFRPAGTTACACTSTIA